MIDISTYSSEAIIPKPEGKEKSFSDLLNKEITFFGSGLSDKKKEQFYTELSILFNAGLDIKTILELICEQQKKQEDKKLFISVKEIVLKGENLSEALCITKKFSEYEYQSIKIGEETGKLKEVLTDLAEYFNKKMEQKRQLVGALSHPLIILTVALGVIWFMLSVIVPLFTDLYKNFGKELPALTKTIVNASQLFSKYAPLTLLFLFSIGIFLYANRKKDWLRKAVSDLALRIPVMGSLIKKIYLARFCKSMNLLLSAKTPIVNALELVQKMVGFYPIEVSLAEIRRNIMKGESFHENLARFPVYEGRMISLVKAGEEINQLDVIFSKLSKQYMSEAEHQTSLLKSSLEPLLMVFIGLFVGVILIAMYLPILKMGTIFH